MKVLSFLIISLLFPFVISAKESSYVVVRGEVRDKDIKQIRLMIVDLFGSKIQTIPVGLNHQFDFKVSINHVVKFGVIFKTIPAYFYAFPGDSIKVIYDSAAQKPIGISSQSIVRTNEINYDIKTIFEETIFQDSIIKATKLLEDSSTYNLAASFYKSGVSKLIKNKSTLPNTFNILINDLYFSLVNFLEKNGLKNFEKLIKPTTNAGYVLLPSNHYSALSKRILLDSYQYRLFLFNSYRKKPDSLDATLFAKFGDGKKAAPWIEYNKAKFISDEYIREWFMTKSILFSFENYDMAQSNKVMDDFLSKCKYSEFSAVLRAERAFFDKNNFEGIVAPQFSLEDYNGKQTSLSNYKGKVIYLNFWGIHCAPCIDQIKNHFTKLHSQYSSKNIVFINICIDAKVNEWKDDVKKYKLRGVNLIGTGNKLLIENYGITAIPHYIIVDRDGKIYQYNASEPSVLLSNAKNALEELLP